MYRAVKIWISLFFLGCATHAHSQIAQKVGGHGGLHIFPNGSLKWGEGNFLVRTRQLFANQGLLVVVMDAPSDRQISPNLSGFRERPEHVADIKAVIAWALARLLRTMGSMGLSAM